MSATTSRSAHTRTHKLVDLYDVMRTTFAAREFTGEPLPDSTLYRILDNARFAPSGGNRQAVRIIVVRDQQTHDRLAELSVPSATWRSSVSERRPGIR
jgi:nitroreductase